MNKKKGVALPLVIILCAFIMFLGGIAIRMSQSTHRISYANVKKMQSFYLAKAGAEMGYGFLSQPAELNQTTGNNWFQLGNSLNDQATFNSIKTKLQNRLGSVPAKIEVYLDDSTPSHNVYFYSPGYAGTKQGRHYGDIEVNIDLVSTSATDYNKENSIFRITSKANIKLAANQTVADTYTMRLDVRVSNKFDKKYS